MIFYNGRDPGLLIFVEKKSHEIKSQAGMRPMRIPVHNDAFVGTDKTKSKIESTSKCCKNGSNKKTRRARTGGFSV